MSISRRRNKAGQSTYIVRWRDGDKEKSKSFKRSRDAKDYDAEIRNSLKKGTYLDPGAAKITLSDFANQWLADHTVAPSTRAKYRSLLDAQILPALGHLRLDQVTPQNVRMFLARSEKKPSTVRTISALLSSISAAAVDDERIRKSFMPTKLALPREQADHRVFLKPEQVHALVEAAPERYQALIYTAAWTGLRWGELAGLKRSRVDLEKATLEVHVALVDHAGTLSLSPPKTPASQRTVRLTRINAEVLSKHMATYLGGGRMGLVFTTELGHALRDDNWRKRIWKPLVKGIGSVPDETRFHDLRHTHVALCLAVNMNMKAIQSRLGHSSIKVTMDRYGHRLDSVEERDMASLDALGKPLSSHT